MYAELQMELETKEINYRQSSNLQGVIMENISPEYAARLHGNQLNPYSQCITRENNSTIWTIKTLNEEAYENIIMPLSECTDIFLRKKGLSISVCNKRMHLKNDNELITEFYEKKCPKYLEIKFQTPTAFKSDGKYVIYPDLGLIYASLMRKVLFQKLLICLMRKHWRHLLNRVKSCGTVCRQYHFHWRKFRSQVLQEVSVFILEDQKQWQDI